MSRALHSLPLWPITTHHSAVGLFRESRNQGSRLKPSNLESLRHDFTRNLARFRSISTLARALKSLQHTCRWKRRPSHKFLQGKHTRSFLPGLSDFGRVNESSRCLYLSDDADRRHMRWLAEGFATLQEGGFSTQPGSPPCRPFFIGIFSPLPSRQGPCRTE